MMKYLQKLGKALMLPVACLPICGILMGIGYALCLDRLVNTEGRNLTFRPIVPELSVDLYIVTKKYQTFSPAVRVFIEQLKTSIE